MDTDELASMYSQIVNGVPKNRSRFVTDNKSSALWDQIAAEVAQMKADNPNVQFAVPNELPRMDGPDDPAWTGKRRDQGGPGEAGAGEAGAGEAGAGAGEGGAGE